MAGCAGPAAVAVSGGSDSLALMHLLGGHARAVGRPAPVVLTVDHGLRAGSAREAKQVACWAGKAGLKAHILAWRGSKPKTGVEAAARAARYRLMGAWLAKHGIATLFVGHTQDDQAETFLLRLARGSGLDGLAAMRARVPWPEPGFAGLAVARPLLGFSRAELRAFLEGIGQPWLDDPMNDDESFDRVRIRKAQDALAQAGLSPARIASAAAHLARARAALETVTEAVLVRAARPQGEAVLLDPQALAAAPREVGLRALAAVLMQVSGHPYRPRFDALERLFDRIAAGGPGGGATLHGCHIGPAAKARAGSGARLLRVRPESPRKTGGSVQRPQSDA
ncbi:MAG TPA: tRNA lysidine(34) synthetase TilS [Rhizomicrobium sp.]|nr:tRNA lysidine(34) synthetase TilS [Rhizomicrobium sp.]